MLLHSKILRILKNYFGSKIQRIKNDKVEILLSTESSIEAKRFKSFITKEPETIEWIEKLIKNGDTFFDIGANIGTFSLYAQIFHRNKITTFTFEPAFHNYYKLCKNIILNGLESQVTAYALSLGKSTSLNLINLSSLELGSADNRPGKPRDQFNKLFKPKFLHGTMVITFDELIYKHHLPTPNHIKIDVDGDELAVLLGAKKLLRDKKLKSLMVEITDINSAKKKIDKLLFKNGFEIRSPINYQINHSRVRRESADLGQIKNIIYTKAKVKNF